MTRGPRVGAVWQADGMGAANGNGGVTAPQLKGYLLHRCVLTAATGQWLSVQKMRRRRRRREDPQFVLRARQMAEQLDGALRDALCNKDEDWGRYLVHLGGPQWSKAYDDFCQSLDEPQQNYVLEGLEELSATIAEALLRRAEKDGDWKFIRAEIDDPIEQLISDDSRGGTVPDVARGRPDLVVDRGKDKEPLVIDLKTGRLMPDIEMMVEDVRNDYGAMIATKIGRSVKCLVLGVQIQHPRGARWSRVERGDPDPED